MITKSEKTNIVPFLRLIKSEGPSAKEANDNTGVPHSECLGIGEPIGRLKEIIDHLEQDGGIKVDGRPKIGLGLKRNIEEGREDVVKFVNEIASKPEKLLNVRDRGKEDIVGNIRDSVDRYDEATELLYVADKHRKQGRFGEDITALGSIALAFYAGIKYGASKGVELLSDVIIPDAVPLVLGAVVSIAATIGYLRKDSAEDKIEGVDDKVGHAKSDFSHAERIIEEAENNKNTIVISQP